MADGSERRSSARKGCRGHRGASRVNTVGTCSAAADKPDCSERERESTGEARVAEVFKDARKKEYLNAEGADKPLKSPIPLATLKRARAYHKQRFIDYLKKHEC